MLLKAAVCNTLGVDDFFKFDKAKKELYKAYKAHNSEELILLSGIYSQFVEAKTKIEFHSHWSVFSEWNEEVR